MEMFKACGNSRQKIENISSMGSIYLDLNKNIELKDYNLF
jgi:hypothetical protein